MAHGILRRGMGRPDSIALVSQAEAKEPRDGPAALIVVDGAPLSHRVIGLVANGLPTVLINAARAKLLKPGSEVCVDGAQGLITVCDSMPVDAPTPCLRIWRRA